VVAKVMAVVVALFLLGGTVSATNFHVATSTVELDDAPVDAVVPVQPVLAIAPIRHTITIVMPSLDEPNASAFAPRTFRPPRG
jgi:hypothetical protein